MAVELQELYEAVKSSYNIKLRTKSCYGKDVEWIHMVEETEFVKHLHGDELALNTGINHHTDEWLSELIACLNAKGVAGLILSIRDNTDISQEVIDYCDELNFPFFTTAWTTPYVEVMRIFSSILLKKNEIETTLSTSLKNAIYYPNNAEIYRMSFERHGYLDNTFYNIAILKNGSNDIEKQIKWCFKRSITYKVEEKLVVLFAGYQKTELIAYLKRLCEKNDSLFVGLGSTVNHINEIYISFEHAAVSFQLAGTEIQNRILDYEELGVYKIIVGVKNQNICYKFVEEVLGKLIVYDNCNKVPLLYVLEAYFENECSITRTADALFFHINTMKYKLGKIKEILGYDILSNENRMKIMLAFHIKRSRNI